MTTTSLNLAAMARDCFEVAAKIEEAIRGERDGNFRSAYQRLIEDPELDWTKHPMARRGLERMLAVDMEPLLPGASQSMAIGSQ